MTVFKGHKIQVNHLLNVIPESLLTTDNFSIVTVKANPFLTDIHNNPRLNESRIPLILCDENAELWIHTSSNSKDMDKIKSITIPAQTNLIAHTVRPLRGKHSVGNSPKASELFHYNDLNSLF